MEKRRYERVRITMPVEWGTDDNCPFQDRITSISVGGCFIQTPRALKAGRTVSLRLFLSAGPARTLRGEVRYCLDRVGLGVEFRGLMEREKEQIAELVEFFRDAQPRTPPPAPSQPD